MSLQQYAVAKTTDLTFGELCRMLADSRLFGNNPNEIGAKILIGRELGFEPMGAVTGIHVIDGKASLSANLMAAMVQKSTRYAYRVKLMTDTVCEIEFLERLPRVEGRPVEYEKLGTSTFGADDVARAGLAKKDNYVKWPRNMLFSRAMSNGIKWYCPELSHGSPLYTPDELGAEVDADGNVVVKSGKPDPAPTVAGTRAPAPPPAGKVENPGDAEPDKAVVSADQIENDRLHSAVIDIGGRPGIDTAKLMGSGAGRAYSEWKDAMQAARQAIGDKETDWLLSRTHWMPKDWKAVTVAELTETANRLSHIADALGQTNEALGPGFSVDLLHPYTVVGVVGNDPAAFFGMTVREARAQLAKALADKIAPPVK